tara:strand:+ start:87 stop:431 length:345 start_codon:yes stop_codon:yes gene_type:complete
MSDTIDNLLARSPEEFRTRAIQALVPFGTSWGFNSDDNGYRITFHNPKDSDPTRAEIDAKALELQAEYDALEYARNRQAEYPDWGTQLEKIADDGIDKWKTEMVDPVKAKYPKP